VRAVTYSQITLRAVTGLVSFYCPFILFKVMHESRIVLSTAWCPRHRSQRIAISHTSRVSLHEFAQINDLL
jgi:hypothetical protein